MCEKDFSFNQLSSECYQPYSQPGAAPFGNFINYYQFNSVSARIKAIPTELVSHLGLSKNDLICLDIGCNAGDLTMALYEFLEEICKEVGTKIYVIGIDLDEALISRCKNHNLYPSNVFFYHLDIMSENSTEILQSYLKYHGKENFDLVTCFSVTMWIHLNHGDNGLLNFLKIISNIAECILIEPQEWKSYKSALRRTQRLKCCTFDLNNIKIHDIVAAIDSDLSSCSMKRVKCLAETSWGRKLYFYKPAIK